MLIRFFSFDFDISSYLTKEKFIQYVASCDEGEFDLSGKKRIFYFKEATNADYYLGLLVTIKDQKKFTTMQARKIKINEMSAGQDFIELNYFVLGKKSHRILFQYYHQSCSVHQFALFLSGHHDELAKKWVAEQKKKQSSLPENKQKTDKQLKKEFGRLFYHLTTRKEGLPALMQELDKISFFEYPVQSLDVFGKDGQSPLTGWVSRIKQRIVFNQKGSNNQIIDGLVGFINSQKISKGKVIGRDINDVPRVIDLIENNSFHAEYEFEDLISKLDNGEASKLEDNAIINELLKVAEKIKLNVKGKV